LGSAHRHPHDLALGIHCVHTNKDALDKGEAKIAEIGQTPPGVARFHPDAYWTLRSTAPRWYRRIFDHRLRMLNIRQLRRWLDDPDYDPVFEVRHRHSADWAWW